MVGGVHMCVGVFVAAHSDASSFCNCVGVLCCVDISSMLSHRVKRGIPSWISSQICPMFYLLSGQEVGGSAGREASISVLCLCKEWQSGVRRAERSGNAGTV